MNGSGEEFVRVVQVSKSFPGVQALDNVDMVVHKGEVYGLVGENGSGKSTLIKILMGVHQKDSGKIYIKGEEVNFKSPLEAQKKGLSAVYQDVIIAPELSVGENFFLGKLPLNRLGFVDWNKVYEESQKTLHDLGLEIDPRRKIFHLSFGDRAMIVIAKVVREKANLVIFDEPTSRLTIEETDTLFNLIRLLRDKGLGIIYISHRLEEIFKICDTVSVLRDGQMVGTSPLPGVDENKIVSMMVGRSIEEMYNIRRAEPGEVLLEVKNLTRDPDFRNLSFSLRRGEVLGFYGLIGSGRTEIMRIIFGVEKPDSGEVIIKGKPVKFAHPYQAMAQGVGLVPEDRKVQGLAMSLTVRHNINISSYGDIANLGFIRRKEELSRAKKLVDALNIYTPSIEQVVNNLSGGNQQKVVIAKWFAKNVDVLILDEPTTGVDVGAKVEIYSLIEGLIQQGKAVIIVSSYLAEVMGLADRILVMAEGDFMGEVRREDADEELLVSMACKVTLNSAAH